MQFDQTLVISGGSWPFFELDLPDQELQNLDYHSDSASMVVGRVFGTIRGAETSREIASQQLRRTLAAWVQDSPDEQRDTLKKLQRDLDAHRESPRKLFPDEDG